jgi:glycoside/pentoside/hexuronide:cation symporter, GPH family
MAKYQTSTTNKVPMGQKIAFGLGMLANQLFPAVLGIFIVILIDKLGFPGWMLSVIYFIPKLFDAVTDPIMGFITDNTKSKWGRRRQYVIIGGIITGISFALMWQLYPENSVNYNFTYFLLVSLAFYLGITIFSVPYVAMGYEMSDDFHERTSIMAVSQLIGQLAWVFAPWLWVIMYDVKFFPSAEEATRTLAVYVAIGCTLLAVIPGIFIKSRSTLNENYEPLNLKNAGRSFDLIIQGFKEALKIVPFRKLCIATFFIFNAFNTTAGFSFFIIKYYLFNGDGQGVWPTLFGSVGAIFTTLLIIPVVARMSKVMGKKKAFIWSQGVSILGYISLLFLFVPGKPYLFLFALPFISFGIGSLFTLMMSMTSDVIDIDELNTGKRREGIFGAIYWWMVKFGLAIAGLLSGAILSVIHFKSGAATQTYETMFELRLFFSAIPVLGTLAAIWVMRNYDVTEEKSREISAELARRKMPKSSGYGVNSVFAGLHLKGLTKPALLKKYPVYFNTGIDFETIKGETINKQFGETFNKGMHGICLTVFTEDQNPGDKITEEQIVKRLKVLTGHAEWIRVFSTTNGYELIPAIAKKMGFKVLMGAWIDKNKEQNESEIQSLIKLVKEGSVDMAAVGNEVLFRGDQDKNTLINYINEVKRNTSGVPVCCVDIYSEFINHPELINASDKILINCYPFWEGAAIEHAGVYLQEMYNKVKAVANGKEVIITETGWPSAGQVVGEAVPSKENLMLYFMEAQLWAAQASVKLFYFSSFDEAWKIHSEGWAGTSWGLWDANENFKVN